MLGTEGAIRIKFPLARIGEAALERKSPRGLCKANNISPGKCGAAAATCSRSKKKKRGNEEGCNSRVH